VDFPEQCKDASKRKVQEIIAVKIGISLLEVSLVSLKE